MWITFLRVAENFYRGVMPPTLGDDTLDATPMVISVLHRAKDGGAICRLVMRTGHALDIRVTHLGSDYVAGEPTHPLDVVVVIPLRSLVSLECDGVGEAMPLAGDLSGLSPRRTLGALLANSQRLCHRVIVHTGGRHTAGVITSVATDAIAIRAREGREVMALIAGIEWIVVQGN
jgi:hypothetical protein